MENGSYKQRGKNSPCRYGREVRNTNTQCYKPQAYAKDMPVNVGKQWRYSLCCMRYVDPKVNHHRCGDSHKQNSNILHKGHKAGISSKGVSHKNHHGRSSWKEAPESSRMVKKVTFADAKSQNITCQKDRTDNAQKHRPLAEEIGKDIDNDHFSNETTNHSLRKIKIETGYTNSATFYRNNNAGNHRSQKDGRWELRILQKADEYSRNKNENSPLGRLRTQEGGADIPHKKSAFSFV